ncbi:hypothetical protein [Nocardia sp. NBC_01327]|uniref:hypothetical protein n=1 Tax=Nocardia sp. NBC_01327 TaxID=2903593 RepID=UPI002E12D1F9|nr:hypothetical protein OG326_42755 [Nocardia sp. NBC_01327]
MSRSANRKFGSAPDARLAQVFIGQLHQSGMEAEADFGEVMVRCRGELAKWFLFSLRMSYSGKAVHRISTASTMCWPENLAFADEDELVLVTYRALARHSLVSARSGRFEWS